MNPLAAPKKDALVQAFKADGPTTRRSFPARKAMQLIPRAARPAQENPVPKKSPSLADLGLQRKEASTNPETSTRKLASLLALSFRRKA